MIYQRYSADAEKESSARSSDVAGPWALELSDPNCERAGLRNVTQSAFFMGDSDTIPDSHGALSYISNANIGQRNTGLNATLPYFGFSWFYSR